MNQLMQRIDHCGPVNIRRFRLSGAAKNLGLKYLKQKTFADKKKKKSKTTHCAAVSQSFTDADSHQQQSETSCCLPTLLTALELKDVFTPTLLGAPRNSNTKD